MNRALKWKLIAGFVLVFLAGGMTGAFIVASQTHHLFLGPIAVPSATECATACARNCV